MIDQVEKMLAIRGEDFVRLGETYERQIRNGEFDIAYKNLWRTTTRHFECGLIRWRRNEFPISDFETVLAFGERLRQGETDWNIESTIAGNSHKWLVICSAAYLLGKPEPLPAERLAEIQVQQANAHPHERADDVLLDFKIIDALAERPWRGGFEDLIARLGSKKRQVLAAHSYRTYLDLLDAKGQSDNIVESLVREAEINYDKRARDAFYGGGPAYSGGTDYNPYMVDFTLAAILKYLNWQGDSIHRWGW